MIDDIPKFDYKRGDKLWAAEIQWERGVCESCEGKGYFETKSFWRKKRLRCEKCYGGMTVVSGQWLCKEIIVGSVDRYSVRGEDGLVVRTWVYFYDHHCPHNFEFLEDFLFARKEDCEWCCKEMNGRGRFFWPFKGMRRRKDKVSDMKPKFNEGDKVWVVEPMWKATECDICKGKGYFEVLKLGWLMRHECKCGGAVVEYTGWGCKEIVVDSAIKYRRLNDEGKGVMTWVYLHGWRSEYIEDFVFATKDEAERCCEELNEEEKR